MSMANSKDQQALTDANESSPQASEGALSRRLFIRIALTTAALGSVPAVLTRATSALAQSSGGGEPVALPHHCELIDTAMGTLSGVVNATYDFQFSVVLDVAPDQVAIISGLSAMGSHVSGDDVGPITVTQTGDAFGSYDMGTLDLYVDVPIAYMQGGMNPTPGHIGVSGLLQQGNAEVTANLNVPNGPEATDDVGGITIWSLDF